MYANYFASQSDYENSTKKFISVLENNHWLKKSNNYYNKMMKKAYENNDKDTVVSLFIDILDYEETKIATECLNYVLDSISKKNEVLFDQVIEYINLHDSEHNFCTHILLAAHHSDDADKLEFHLHKALEIGEKNREVALVKSDFIKGELLAKHKSHNSTLQSIISEFSPKDILPEDPSFFEWEFEAAEKEPEVNENEKEKKE